MKREVGRYMRIRDLMRLDFAFQVCVGWSDTLRK